MTDMIGFDDIQRKLALLSRPDTLNGMGKALFQGGLVLEADIKQRIKQLGLIDTRNMTNGVTTDVISPVFVAVFINVAYNATHEFGATITPRSAKLLSWVSKDGDRVFAKKVVIPARPHWRPAVMSMRDEIARAVAYSLDQWIRGVV